MANTDIVKLLAETGGIAEHQSYPKLRDHHDGNLYRLNAGPWQSVGNDWLLFGKLRASREKAQYGVDSYK